MLFLHCGKSPEQYITHLQGYWEIDQVTLSDGTKKDYTFSNTVDYFYVSDSLTGFRKKLKPSFTGSYNTSKDSEPFTLSTADGKLTITYTTALDQWQETVTFASAKTLQIINTNNITYTYKRYTPINVTNE